MTTKLLKNAIEGYKKDIKELEKAYKPIAKISDAKSKAMLQDLVIERVIELNKRIEELETLIKRLDTSSTKNEVYNVMSKDEVKVDSLLDIHQDIKKEIDKDYNLCECGHNKNEHGHYLGSVLDSCHHKTGSHYCKCKKFTFDKLNEKERANE